MSVNSFRRSEGGFSLLLYIREVLSNWFGTHFSFDFFKPQTHLHSSEPRRPRLKSLTKQKMEAVARGRSWRHQLPTCSGGKNHAAALGVASRQEGRLARMRKKTHDVHRQHGQQDVDVARLKHTANIHGRTGQPRMDYSGLFLQRWGP